MFFKKFEDGKTVGYMITEENLRHILTQIDFDSNPSPKFFESLGYAVVIEGEKPTLTPYQIATEFETENEDGSWQQQWEITEVSDAEKKKIFDDKLKEVTDHQTHLLDIYASQLEDPNEPPEELIIIQLWIDATKGMDLSDPFNVVWPSATNTSISPNFNDVIDPPMLPKDNNLTTVKII
jgi:hypothetical protein